MGKVACKAPVAGPTTAAILDVASVLADVAALDVSIASSVVNDQLTIDEI
jgi:hypothetical protein